MAKKKKDKRDGEKTILDELKKDKDGRWIMPLKNSFRFGDRDVKQLLLDEPKAKHLRAFSSDPDMDEILKVIADLSHEPDSLIDELSLKDSTRCTDFFGAFE